MSATIRAARMSELELLRKIETMAGTLFVDVGLSAVAEQEPASIDELADYVRRAHAWVSTEADVPVGYAVVDIVDGLAHLEQLSVSPEHGRSGHGSALLEHVCTWAVKRYPAVTLTTFTDIPWNAPFYAKHGFSVMTEAGIGAELRALRAHETDQGLDPALCVCMRRDLPS